MARNGMGGMAVGRNPMYGPQGGVSQKDLLQEHEKQVTIKVQRQKSNHEYNANLQNVNLNKARQNQQGQGNGNNNSITPQLQMSAANNHHDNNNKQHGGAQVVELGMQQTEDRHNRGENGAQGGDADLLYQD